MNGENMRMAEEDMREVQLSREEIFKGRVVHLQVDTVRLPDGSRSTREVIRHPGGVGILPLMPDGTVMMVQQFRYPGDSVLTEIPAGKLEYGEDPLACGKRELKEEIGAEAMEWVFLGNVYPTPAYDSEVIRVYLAAGLTFGEQHLDEGEFLNVCRIPLQALADKVMAGEIRDAKTQIAILKTVYMLEHGALSLPESDERA